MAYESKKEAPSETPTQYQSPSHDQEKITLEAQKPLEVRVDDTQYPQGLKFVLLAGASIVAVFLIALDQVRIHFLHAYHPGTCI